MYHPLASSPIPRSLLLLVCLLLGWGAVQAQEETKKVKAVMVTLVTDTKAVAPGKPFAAGVKFEIEKEWDIYWQFVGDIGVPTSVEWELPPGFTAGALQWPLPQAHVGAGDFLNYVYLNEAMLFAEITPPAQLPPGPLTIKAKLKWQMCDPQTCVPGDAELALPLTAGQPEAANQELFARWRAKLPKTTPPPFTVKWDRSKANEFSLRIEGLPKEFQAEFFPLPPQGLTPGHPKTSAVAADGARTITFPLESGGAPNLPWRGIIATGKDGTPREGWTIDATSGDTFSPSAAAATTAPAGRNLFALLWSAFLGGLILNLMPCVLPVIALKIFGFVQQAGEEPRRVFRLGLAFVGGVFAFFLGLAALIVGLKAFGVNLTWGFQFQNPAILIALIVLVFIFGLNLLGVFEIMLAGGTASKLSELSSREGYGGAFTHGLFTTLLGTSCTAPFLGAVLGFAFVAPGPIVFLIFAAIAAGMSLPYFLLTANPAWMRFLPKPGMWMERLKQLMGFVMLGVVVWLLGVYGGGNEGVAKLTALSGFLLVVAGACWIYGSFGQSLVSWLSIAVLLATGYLFLLQPRAYEHLTWEPWSEQRVAEATTKGQPVFVDFTADWCLNCKANEKFVIDTAPIRAAFKAKNVLTLKADWTKNDPVIYAVLQKYDRAGVPAYLLYPAGDATPIVLPEILTKNILLAEIERLKK